jgi:Rieske Fe-S protein
MGKIENNDHESAISEAKDGQSRRSVLTWVLSLAMTGSLLAAYGSLAGIIGRFLYPARPARKGWLFVREVARLPPGEALLYHLPDGSPVHIRRGDSAIKEGLERNQLAKDSLAAGESFSALSSTCPHLGCQVHWEAHNDRFFCPCHNGVFTPEGKAIAGPPADAGQSLLQYPLKIEAGLLFIQAPLETLANNEGADKTPTALGTCSPGATQERRS